MEGFKELQIEFNKFIKDPEKYPMHPSDLGNYLKGLRARDVEKFKNTLLKFPHETLGPVLLELPEKLQNEAFAFLPHEKLARATEGLESDDATDLVQELVDADESKGHEVISKLEKDDREEINALRQYSEEQAGSIMQMEVFKASVDENIRKAISRLADEKEEGKLRNIYQVFIVDKENVLVASAALSDLITMNFNISFQDLVKGREFPDKYKVNEFNSIEDVVKLFEHYDLTYAPVVNSRGELLGRITSDDIFDEIQDLATEQIYNLAGVDDEAEEENYLRVIFQKRASWLLLNLITAIFASLVIAQFDETLKAYIPLAILMPIVASMGGNAGTQSLTVMVRQIALGDVVGSSAYSAIRKEIIISILNGLLFALIMGFISYYWFSNKQLGFVIGFALIINLLVAGLFGALIPLVLKKMNSDPAVGSTVIITTLTDVVGFLSFLGLAKIMLF
ncbi:MAG: magnesium transporter [Epsilonproteobacteria bacterium]|nr:MAG: magnesium transporter [Campylobacterota bacterium]RLA64896.1 MAG: magnesium transporter [Campylobacterota bacterium]